LRELHLAGADMDRADNDGLTPLLTTLMESGWLSTAKLLLQAGANASYVNTNEALRKYA
jgi:ankyrin repeat protein